MDVSGIPIIHKFYLIYYLHAVLAARSFVRRKVEVRKMQNLLSFSLSTIANLRSDRYTRLIALGVMDVLVTIPLSSYYIYIAAFVDPISSYDWDSTHYGFNRVDTFPVVLWREIPGAAGLELCRWIYVIGAALFFILFGLGEDARNEYRKILIILCCSCGIMKSNENPPTGPVLTFTLPSYAVPTDYTVTVQSETRVSSANVNGETESINSSEKSLAHSFESFDAILVEGSP